MSADRAGQQVPRRMPAIFAGTNASQCEAYESATARTALGKSTEAIGMTSAFAGSAMVVARWKYHAIGNASARLMTIETNSSSVGAQQQPGHSDNAAYWLRRGPITRSQALCAAGAFQRGIALRASAANSPTRANPDCADRSAADRLSCAGWATAMPATAMTDRNVS